MHLKVRVGFVTQAVTPVTPSRLAVKRNSYQLSILHLRDGVSDSDTFDTA